MLILYTALLTVITVSIHAAGSIFILKCMPTKKMFIVLLVVRLSLLVCLILTMHFAESAVFAWYYLRQGAFTSFDVAMYFSITSYTTIGYGDYLLQDNLRILGGYEGLLGSLMVGWSTALIIKILHTQTEGTYAISTPSGRTYDL
ncbi:two pore domain potassium channel family protein [Enterobacter roggenkampii]|uniref:two pore domain potassium channel family protein n=1 Tax=Enterobacter roggenkampii TaxID=1812935 RepID=UPI0013B42EE9|nr:two pore domain potassium channel family protein [Enterobacter roggenkampii]